MEKTQKIINCQSFDELLRVLNEIGDIEGSRGYFYTPKENIERVNMVINGAPINTVTRGNGLRSKVAELLHYSR